MSHEQEQSSEDVRDLPAPPAGEQAREATGGFDGSDVASSPPFSVSLRTPNRMLTDLQSSDSDSSQLWPIP